MRKGKTMDFAKMKTTVMLRRFVLPQMVAMLVNSVYFIVDGIFIGRRLGTDALAAAGVAVPVVEVTIALAMMISVGAGVMVSAEKGRGRPEEARRLLNLAMRFALLFSLGIMLLGALFAGQLARLLGASDVIVTDTVTYLRVFLLFCPFFIFSYILSTFVRNDGRPVLAMCALTVGSLSNILLDYVFMYPLNMGITGAALATGLGPVLSVAIMLPHFIRRRGSLYFEKKCAPARMVGGMLLHGLPALVSEFTIGLVTLLYNLAIVRNGLGEAGLASYIVIGYAALLCMAVFLGAAQGLQPAISYFVGARQFDAIRRLVRMGGIFCLGVGLALYGLLLATGKYFYGIFIPADAALLATTVQNANFYFACLPFAALNILLGTCLQAMQEVVRSLVVSLSRCTLPLLASLLLLPMLLPGTGLWLAVLCTEAFTLVVALVLWQRLWRGHKLAPAVGKAARLQAKPG